MHAVSGVVRPCSLSPPLPLIPERAHLFDGGRTGGARHAFNINEDGGALPSGAALTWVLGADRGQLHGWSGERNGPCGLARAQLHCVDGGCGRVVWPCGRRVTLGTMGRRCVARWGAGRSPLFHWILPATSQKIADIFRKKPRSNRGSTPTSSVAPTSTRGTAAPGVGWGGAVLGTQHAAGVFARRSQGGDRETQQGDCRGLHSLTDEPSP